MKRLLVLLLCTSVVFLSCKDNQIGSALNSAEISMNDNPEFSLEILESIDKDLLSTRKQKAKYALLYSIALDKNYIDLQSDSIIAPAIKYYERHGSIDDKIRSLYYYARIQYNAGEYNPAIITLMKTLSLFEDSSEVRLFALIHNLLAIIYNDSWMFHESLEHINKGYSYAIACDDLRLADIILRRKGIYYLNVKDYNNAIDIFKQILLNDRIGTLKSEVMCDCALAHVLNECEQYEEAIRLYGQALEISPNFYSANHWGAYAHALDKVGDTDLAEQIFAQLSAQSQDGYFNVVYNYWKHLSQYEKNNFKGAYTHLNNIMPYQDSIYRTKLHTSAIKAQRDFLSYKNTQIEIEKKHKNIVLLLIIAVLLLLSVLLYYILRRRLEQALKEKESLFEISETVQRQLILLNDERNETEQSLRSILDSKDIEINVLRSHIHEKDTKLQELRSEYAHMYKAQFKGLGDLCETFIRANEYRDSHRMVYEKVKYMLKEINGDRSGHLRFEKMIDKSLNNIMKHFRDDFPNYNENDYRFVSYIIVGFDATTLAVIFDMPSQASVYMRKSRIKKQIINSGSDYKQSYLEMFD